MPESPSQPDSSVNGEIINPSAVSAVREMRPFTPQRKQAFLELFRKTPNATACAQALGICREAVYGEMRKDQEFASAFKAARDGQCDNLENLVYEFAHRPTNVIDRLAYLRAFRPERWNPEKKINLRHTIDAVKRLEIAENQYVSHSNDGESESTPPG